MRNIFEEMRPQFTNYCRRES